MALLLGNHPSVQASPLRVGLVVGRQVCANIYATRLAVDTRAVVAPEPPYANIVRSRPTRTAASIGMIQPGAAMTIIDGPVCADGWIWWFVRADSGTTGWTSEGDAEGYWLAPLATTNTPAHITNLYSCLQPCQADGSDSRGVFPQAISRIHLRWQYDNIPPDASYVRVWSKDGREWIRYACYWPGPANGIHAISLLESSGLESGVWEMRIEVEGQVIAETSVFVSGSYKLWEPVGVRTDCAEGITSVNVLRAIPTSSATALPPINTVPLTAFGLVNDNANLRSGPGTNYAKIGRLDAGTVVAITGKNSADTWYQLDTVAWIASFLVDLCDNSYPSVCIPVGIADLDCAELPFSDFPVRPPDPHGLDGDGDGIGCEDTAYPTATVRPPTPTPRPPTPTPQPPSGNCDPSYPGVCIPPYPPDLDCGQISYRRFQVIGNDPHGLDGDGDGIGCEN